MKHPNFRKSRSAFQSTVLSWKMHDELSFSARKYTFLTRKTEQCSRIRSVMHSDNARNLSNIFYRVRGCTDGPEAPPTFVNPFPPRNPPFKMEHQEYDRTRPSSPENCLFFFTEFMDVLQMDQKHHRLSKSVVSTRKTQMLSNKALYLCGLCRNDVYFYFGTWMSYKWKKGTTDCRQIFLLRIPPFQLEKQTNECVYFF